MLGSWDCGSENWKGHFGHVFSFEGFYGRKDSGGNNGIDQCIKDHSVNLQSRFSKYLPEAISDKYKWITDPFHVDSSENYEFLLEEEEEENIYTNIIYLVLL